ncbi:MAG: cryptochrome/photolyase family protein [Candidatus Latescibacteria bacterium]|nr:cryptochrome/photolyase family protein [bacterium]MBD3424171.1 cryptochrome/photolyase family protein [Candidatus Latescibacterota bacterium]
MKEAAIVFPTHLFREHPCIRKGRAVFIVEEPRYFTDFRFHRKKLMLHRASMKGYQEFLDKKGFRAEYVEFSEDWRERARRYRLFAVRPFDRKLEESLPEGITLEESPSFLGGELERSGHYLMASFYRRQRKRLGILMEGDRPAGGKWSFDSENRKKLPRGHRVPEITGYPGRHVEEAAEYVKVNFPENPGEAEGFVYPVTFRDARRWLEQFVRERLELFGDYEDAISEKDDFVYHSLLSPLLNIGLLTPAEVIERVLSSGVPLNSKEGFVRQVIGWREFILKIYLLEGERQRSSNFFGNRRKLPQSFYTASTGMPPVDNVIRKVLRNGYCHHIERLMVLGNYMLLSGYCPDEIYRWFMEMFVDAYDWVMVPNLYGMSQYADGGLMSSKPYISSSNYILKMSDFSRGAWCDKWKKLFWSFLEKHRDKLGANPRLALLYSRLGEKS